MIRAWVKMKGIRDLNKEKLNLGLILFFAFIFIANLVVIVEPDLPWYLRAGAEILKQGRLLAHDSFSYTSQRLWMNHEWLSEVLISLAYQVGGFVGLACFKALLVCILLYFLLSTRRGDTSRSYGLEYISIAFGCVFFRELISPRGQMFTDLLFAFSIFLASRYSANQLGFRRFLFAVIGTGILWTQVHGGAPHLVIVLFFLFVSRPSKEKAILLAVAALTTVIGPYGFQVHEHFLNSHQGLVQISEWKPLISLWARSSHTYFIGMMSFVGIAWALGFHRLLRTRKIQFEILLLGFFSVAAFCYVRFLTELLIVAVAIVAQNSDDLARRLRLSSLRSIVVGSLLVLFSIFYSSRPPGFGLSPAVFPREAVDFVRAHGMKGPLFNSYNFGGYLIWALPEEPVFIDGRAFTVYSNEHFDRFVKVFENPMLFADLEREFHFRLAILQPRKTSEALIQWMLDHGWKSKFKDALSIVLTKQESEDGSK